MEGKAIAPTPLALMRSRYCAYSMSRIDYIEKTMRDKALKGFNKEEALAWSRQCQWQGLEIIQAKGNTVHFIAHFHFQGAQQTINENSLFEQIDNQWYYVGLAREEKLSRNAPCKCGSGKKYKRCCL